jgi:hypothetical protein
VTGAEFSGVDIDLLADYVGGALDGTPDEAVVAALITEDAAWREAHARLSGGADAVSGQLRELGSIAEPMPADVVARLDAALLAATSIGDRQSGATVAPAVMEPGTDGAAPVRHLVAVPSGSRSKRARRLRWAAPVGIAAGVLAFVGFGFQQQFAGGSSDEAASSTAGGAAEQSAPLAAAEPFSLPAGPVALSESGTDYRLGTLAQAGQQRTSLDPPLGQAQDGDFRKSVPSSAGKLSASSVELDRLRVQEAMRVCIEAIQSQHGAGEIKPQTIDFARYDGSPAVVVTFLAAGESWVWASGPASGTPGVGADKLASVKVG